MLPILNHLVRVRRPRRIGHPRALVLSPTRELAVQTAENVKRYSKYAELPFACLIGGVSQYGQVKDIKKGAETVVACPGRLIDLMNQGILYLDQVECFVTREYSISTRLNASFSTKQTACSTWASSQTSGA